MSDTKLSTGTDALEAMIREDYCPDAPEAIAARAELAALRTGIAEAVKAALAARYQPQPPEGHNQPCYYCGEPCNALAGNPGKWPLAFPHRDEPGVVKWQHVGCVVARLTENQPVGIAEAVKEACDEQKAEHARCEKELQDEIVRQSEYIRDQTVSLKDYLRMGGAVKAAEEATWIAAMDVALNHGHYCYEHFTTFEHLKYRLIEEQRKHRPDSELDRYVASKVREAKEEIKSLQSYKFALEQHLCKFDLIDWLACNGDHGDYCDVCESQGQDHPHQTLRKVEKERDAAFTSLKQVMKEQERLVWEAKIAAHDSELILRRLLWLRHPLAPGQTVHSCYGDDGEMQCCMIDWKRCSAQFIDEFFTAAGMQQLAEAERKEAGQ